MICNLEETKLSQYFVPVEVIEHPPPYAAAKGPGTGTSNSLSFENMHAATPFFDTRVLDLSVSFDFAKPNHRDGDEFSNPICVVSRHRQRRRDLLQVPRYDIIASLEKMKPDRTAR